MLNKVIVEVGKSLGKAVVAGFGLEVARLVTERMRKRFGMPRDDKADGRSSDAQSPTREEVDELRRIREENARLRDELARLRPDAAAARPAAVDAPDSGAGNAGAGKVDTGG